MSGPKGCRDDVHRPGTPSAWIAASLHGPPVAPAPPLGGGVRAPG
ncbi:hypothetical protein P376_3449 [Streptomyces sp. HCCB10043]|uniref:Predicted protein n=1 Tax=Streptomyces filamentosus NRRL 15998 TaxID=457431 RepID=D6AUI1_STRFL|nr:predicted protein [Streptomyces filamentosus NRRL 15998]ESU48570.1 hypothetical protein P376_3449 [Streptomyces sp. HCCB10043]